MLLERKLQHDLNHFNRPVRTRMPGGVAGEQPKGCSLCRFFSRRINMPFVIVAFFGIFGVLFGADQHDKRRREQQNFRAQLVQLQIELFLREQELAKLSELLGEKNSQVVQLAARVECLRVWNDAWQKRAA
jgi:hypothetical protein